jgi:hypothetical protein
MCCALSLVCGSVLALSAAEQALFDGTTLTGWQGDTTTMWRVENGVIAGGSLEGVKHNDFLASTQRYKNFVLRLEWKLTGTEGFINSGVQIRSERLEKPAHEMKGYQADIGKGWTGSLYDESRRNKIIAQADKVAVEKIDKPGDWNSYEIRCEGPRIRLTVNGVQTIDYTEMEADIPLDGHIALQIHGGAKAVVYFRNITIETLPE